MFHSSQQDCLLQLQQCVLMMIISREKCFHNLQLCSNQLHNSCTQPACTDCQTSDRRGSHDLPHFHHTTTTSCINNVFSCNIIHFKTKCECGHNLLTTNTYCKYWCFIWYQPMFSYCSVDYKCFFLLTRDHLTKKYDYGSASTDK